MPRTACQFVPLAFSGLVPLKERAAVGGFPLSVPMIFDFFYCPDRVGVHHHDLRTTAATTSYLLAETRPSAKRVGKHFSNTPLPYDEPHQGRSVFFSWSFSVHPPETCQLG